MAFKKINYFSKITEEVSSVKLLEWIWSTQVDRRIQKKKKGGFNVQGRENSIKLFEFILISIKKSKKKKKKEIWNEMGGKKKKTKQVNRFALLTSVKFRLVSLKTFYKRKKKKEK